jgi:hypothetical protein
MVAASAGRLVESTVNKENLNAKMERRRRAKRCMPVEAVEPICMALRENSSRIKGFPSLTLQDFRKNYSLVK